MGPEEIIKQICSLGYEISLEAESDKGQTRVKFTLRAKKGFSTPLESKGSTLGGALMNLLVRVKGHMKGG